VRDLEADALLVLPALEGWLGAEVGTGFSPGVAVSNSMGCDILQ
jgi:hypothetical protein